MDCACANQVIGCWNCLLPKVKDNTLLQDTLKGIVTVPD